MMKLAFAVAAALALTACGQKTEQPASTPAASPETTQQAAPAATAPAATAAEMPATDMAFAARLDSTLAGEWRSADNKARDAHRHPKETLMFLGVKPGASVVEITPGGGWYAEILAPLLKGNGTYVAAIPLDSASDYAKTGNDRLRTKFGADAERFGEVKYAEFDPAAPSLGMDGSVDVVLTFRNVHNWSGNGSAPGMFKAFFDALKPGGVLGVVEHRAAEGSDYETVKQSGYLPTDYVVKLATDAGFTLAEQSEINANPKDTKDYEKGVWTLPPVLRLKEVDQDKYVAIGESDRMTLKFVKPAGDAIFGQGTDSGPAGAPKQ